ncbi:hypothetical protein [Mycoplasmopsis agassizii]|uniref:Uncharacterized protein n=1 Tax=Mycoplasmopsis agassizii TaxID=33922 RepID=A0ABX4H5X1_9BACT|nr:hypothetical protein [Mycoplasmopsis agassizii]PAF55290.1 hypothetical protein CJF60_01205 [Mycoplasmopsis agassizii]SMC15709.1 hypothetical protein SAMN02745179_00058 [Mycoplasmopsis agassizii]
MQEISIEEQNQKRLNEYHKRRLISVKNFYTIYFVIATILSVLLIAFIVSLAISLTGVSALLWAWISLLIVSVFVAFAFMILSIMLIMKITSEETIIEDKHSLSLYIFLELILSIIWIFSLIGYLKYLKSAKKEIAKY